MNYKLKGVSEDNFTKEEIDKLYNTLGLDRDEVEKANRQIKPTQPGVMEPQVSAGSYFGVRHGSTTNILRSSTNKKER